MDVPNEMTAQSNVSHTGFQGILSRGSEVFYENFIFLKRIPENPQFKREAALGWPSGRQRRERNGVEGRVGRRVCWGSGRS